MSMRQGILSDLDSVIQKDYKNINGIVVLRDGQRVHEKYYNGATAEESNNVASVTKTIMSALIGIAIDQGLIDSVDQKVLDFFPKYPVSANDFMKKSVTIKHLLTMTAPFAFSIKNFGARPFEPLDRIRRQKDWVKHTISLMGVKSQMGQFQYSTPSTHLLSAILTKVSNMKARDYANTYLFDPIGMSQIDDYDMKAYGLDDVFGKNVKGWVKDPQGINAGGWGGLKLTARDMALFGQLYLNQGLWNGRQIISKNWCETSVASNDNNYGYLWWLSEKEKKPPQPILH